MFLIVPALLIFPAPAIQFGAGRCNFLLWRFFPGARRLELTALRSDIPACRLNFRAVTFELRVCRFKNAAHRLGPGTAANSVIRRPTKKRLSITGVELDELQPRQVLGLL